MSLFASKACTVGSYGGGESYEQGTPVSSTCERDPYGHACIFSTRVPVPSGASGLIQSRHNQKSRPRVKKCDGIVQGSAHRHPMINARELSWPACIQCSAPADPRPHGHRIRSHYFLVLSFPQETLPEIEPKATYGSNSHPRAGLSLPMSFPLPTGLVCVQRYRGGTLVKKNSQGPASRSSLSFDKIH